MFIAIYRCQVKSGYEEQFIQNWHKLTQLIYQNQGGLGSRLHQNYHQKNEYIAYAQWPSRELWEQANQQPLDWSEARKLMRESCSHLETIYQLEVIDDLFPIKSFE